MTRQRQLVVLALFAAAVLTGVIGFTNRRLSELRPVAPVAAVVATLIALTGRRPPARKAFEPADWKGNNRAVLHALGTSHGFGPDDLEANRAGRLHPEQRAYGIALGTTDVRFGTVLLLSLIHISRGHSSRDAPRRHQQVALQRVLGEHRGEPGTFISHGLSYYRPSLSGALIS